MSHANPDGTPVNPNFQQNASGTPVNPNFQQNASGPMTSPPVIHNGALPNAPSLPPPPAAPAPAPAAAQNGSTMFLATVSAQYGSTIPKTRLAATYPKTSAETSVRQGQLPMFLSKTYHAVDKTSPDIVTWSANGDSFIIKDPEKFSCEILPQYFKHSNFSSFARQLNFYGFRKLKADPILTADYDARKANYVSFFHEKFKRGHPDLMNEIRRATKAEHTSKDEVDVMREEIASLREQLNSATQYYNHRISEVTADCDRKIGQLWNEMRTLMASNNMVASNNIPMQGNTASPPGVYQKYQGFGHMQTHPAAANANGTHVMMQTHHGDANAAAPVTMQIPHVATQSVGPPSGPGYSMQSLSHVAGVKLLSPSVQGVQAQHAPTQPVPLSLTDHGMKRSPADPVVNDDPAKRSKVDEMPKGQPNSDNGNNVQSGGGGEACI